MTFDIRGKQFAIDFVSNYCHLKYSELIDLSVKIGDDSEIERAKALPPEEGVMVLKDVIKTRREMSRTITAIRSEILRELLETNSIAYDESWWMHKTSADDINEIVVESIKKDTANVRASKKK